MNLDGTINDIFGGCFNVCHASFLALKKPSRFFALFAVKIP
jgi:hypothetical protein